MIYKKDEVTMDKIKKHADALSRLKLDPESPLMSLALSMQKAIIKYELSKSNYRSKR